MRTIYLQEEYVPLLREMVMQSIFNRNRRTPEAFVPEDGEYQMLCGISLALEDVAENTKSRQLKSIKNISTALMDTAMCTGYNYGFLCDMYEEELAEGKTPDEAYRYVDGVSKEHDW